MKVITFILSLLFLTQFGGFAQKTYSVKGAVVDSASDIKLFNTSISILQAKDSILCKFTRAANDGSFSITGLPGGDLFCWLPIRDMPTMLRPSASIPLKIKSISEVLTCSLNRCFFRM